MNIISDAEVAANAKTAAAQQTNTENVEVVEQELSEAKETLAEIGDESDTSKSESEKDALEKEESEKSKRAPGAEKRIKKLSREKNALRSENDNLRARVAALEVHRTAPVNEETSQKQIVQGKPIPPDPNEFASQEAYKKASDAYLEDLTDWKIEQRDVKKRQDDLRTSQQRNVDSYVARRTEFTKTHDDFDEVTEAVGDIPISLTVQQLLLDEGGKPELAYALAKDREEYKRICSLSPLAAARELGKFEAKVLGTDSSKTIEPKKITKAPKPIAPVGTKAKSDLSIYDQELSQADFERLRAEQIKSKRN